MTTKKDILLNPSNKLLIYFCVSGLSIFFKDIVVPIMKPASPTIPIKVFLKIIHALLYPSVVFHFAAVCKRAGKSNPRVDKDKAPKMDER